MPPRHLTLQSPALGRDIHLWCYGHFGPPIVVFPSAAGFAHEWQAQGMIEVLSPFLNAGHFKLYCPESNVADSWTSRDGSLGRRMDRHQRYERFVLDSLVPFIREDCRWHDAPLMATGCSLGATYAALFALKYPETFRRALCMSGRYLTTALTAGQTNDDLYFSNPLAFVPNLQGGALEKIRRNTHLTLVCGQGMWEEGCIEETIALAAVFREKGIPHERDIWGKESRHDWDWWHKQAYLHLGRMFGR